MATPAQPMPAQPPRPYQPLVPMLLAAASGMTCDRLWPVAWHVWWLAAAASGLAWLLAWRRTRDLLATGLLLGSIAATAGAWHHQCWHLFPVDELALFAPDRSGPVCLEAVATAPVRKLPQPAFDPLRTLPLREQAQLDIQVVAIRDGTAWRRASGTTRLLVQGDLVPFEPGDRLRVFGQLAGIMPPMNPGEFDYAAYSRAHRRLAQLRTQYGEAVVRLRAGSPLTSIRALGALRGWGQDVLERYLPSDQAALAGALLLGRRDLLEADRIEAFFTTGLIHILVVSGLHVGVFAASLLFLERLNFMRRRRVLLLVGVLVWLYALVAGAQPPVLRAAVLTTIVCLGRAMGRQSLGLNSLAAAALVVLAVNPADLFQPGAQLSFLAILVLMELAAWQRLRADAEREKPVDPRVLFRPWPHKAALACAGWYGRLSLVALAAWGISLPLVMGRFHLFSPAALLLGPLLWPALLAALVSGFALLGVGWLVPPLGHLLARVCGASLQMIESAVQFGEGVPGSHLWVPGPAAWWLAGFYGLVLAWVMLPELRSPRRRPLVWMAIALWTIVAMAGPLYRAARPADTLCCTFVSLGHGCGVIVELPGGKTLLYDAGRLGSPYTPARSISACLWSRGIRHLDAVVLSHADADHYNALPVLLQRFSIGVVYVSPMMFERPAPALVALKQSIEKAGVPLREIWQGDRLQSGGPAVIDVLHPPRTGVLGTDNANSLVLAIAYQGKRILLPGDLESPGLDDVMAEDPLPCDVLLAPHHGSRFSDPPGLAAWCRPEVLVISGGDPEDADETGQAYRQVGAELYHTARSGAVEVVIDHDGKLTVTAFRPR